MPCICMQGFARPARLRLQPAGLHSQPAEPARRAIVAAERIASGIYPSVLSCMQQRNSIATAAYWQRHGRPCHFKGACRGSGYRAVHAWCIVSFCETLCAWHGIVHAQPHEHAAVPRMQLAPRFQQGQTAGTASLQHTSSLRQPSVSPWHFASQGRRQPQRGVRRLLPISDGLPSMPHQVSLSTVLCSWS